jgi:hypothetical protein
MRKKQTRRGQQLDPHLAAQHDDAFVLYFGTNASQVVPIDFIGGVDLKNLAST